VYQREKPFGGFIQVATDLTQPTLVRGLKNRAFVVKINRLLRF
jgi:hypothetical protein